MASLLACIHFAVAAAPEASDLTNDALTSGDVTTYGMGYGLQRHSPLKQIDRSSVRRLAPVWNLSLSSNQPMEAQPLLYDGVMYVTTVDSTVALDALSGKMLWRSALTLPQDVYGITCCGNHSRGGAIFGGKLFRGTLDAHAPDPNRGYLKAIEPLTGKTRWQVPLEIPNFGGVLSTDGGPSGRGGLERFRLRAPLRARTAAVRPGDYRISARVRQTRLDGRGDGHQPRTDPSRCARQGQRQAL